MSKYTTVKLSGVRHAALTSQDLDRAIRFYTEELGFIRYHAADPDWAMLTLEGTSLSLIRVSASDPKSSATAEPHAGSHPSHLGITAFDSESVDALHARLCRSTLATEVQEPRLHRDGSYGFYLRDPDGNQLEVIFIPLAPRAPGAPKVDESIILLAHGSADAAWRRPFESLLEKLKKHFKDVSCELAYMEFVAPTLDDAVAALKASSGFNGKIAVFPVFMSSGGHVAHDIPALVAEASKRHPSVRIRLLPALGEEASVQEALLSVVISEVNSPVIK